MGGLEKPGRFSIPRRPAWHPAVGLGEEDGWMVPEEQSSGMDRMGRYLSVRRARLRRSSPRAGRTCPFRPAVGGGLGRPNAVFGVAADAGCAEENVRSGGRWGDARGVLGAAWLRCGACGGRRSPVPVPGRSRVRRGMQAAPLLQPSRHAAQPLVSADRTRVHGSATAGVYTPGERTRRVPFSAPDACIWSTG